MLSSQTKDTVNAGAMKRLQTLPLTIPNILACEESQIAEMIRPVSFYRRKAIYLQKTAQILTDQYDSDIPSTLEGLQQLPGVGPKMAHLTMQYAWGRSLGIGVDVHVHRISARLGWTKNAKTPEDTRKQLEDWLPPSLWTEINPLLVGFGQTVCLPLRPRCSTCLAHNLCPSSTYKTDIEDILPELVPPVKKAKTQPSSQELIFPTP